MEKLTTIFYWLIGAGFMCVVSIASMLITSGLAVAENQRYIQGQASVYSIMSIKQLSDIKFNGL